ncbi:MAG: M23 family metallopeptidase, partial [Verrucomicrobiaceae bacterium]
SLYAHLAEITCKPGDEVNAGSVLGRMGYTGAGINRVRAHCHLEVAMMTSSRYEDWHRHRGAGTNFHGNFNGMNLIGTEVARFFLEHKANPQLQFSQFVASTPVYFKVTVPAKGSAVPDFAKRYPWMVKGDTSGATSWEISFSATGQPIAYNPSQRQVATAVITAIRPATVPHRYLTRGLISGEGNNATLSNAGKQLVTLLTDDFPAAPAPATTPKPHKSPSP